MQVVVFGAGAVGSLVGARLHEAGISVRLVARPQQVAAITRHGLRIEAGRDIRIVQITARERFEGGADLILLAVKSQDVLEASREIAGVSLGSTVVTMQNGIRSDAEAASILGRDRVIGCVCYVSVSYLEPGVIVPAGWRGYLRVGAPFPESQPRLDEVHTVLMQAMPVSVAADLERARWTKLIVNLPNVIPAVTGLSVGQTLHEPRLNRLAIAAMREGTQVARASGHPLEASRQGRRFRVLAVLPLSLAVALSRRRVAAQFPRTSAFGGSTQQSLQRGSSSELDYLNGEIVRAGADAGRATPINSALLARGQEAFRTRRFLSSDELIAAIPL